MVDAVDFVSYVMRLCVCVCVCDYPAAASHVVVVAAAGRQKVESTSYNPGHDRCRHPPRHRWRHDDVIVLVHDAGPGSRPGGRVQPADGG